MAKKKKKQSNNTYLSPERLIRDKARSFPLFKCYFSKNWEEVGLTPVIISRRRPGGSILASVFLVDTYCLGVKNVVYYTSLDEFDFEDLVDHWKEGMPLEEVSYSEAHNLILGAVEFAEEAGIHPHKSFEIGKWMLEDDTDDIPLIEYTYGKDGKYILVVSENLKEMVYFNTLRNRLGDRFQYVVPVKTLPDGITDEDFEDIEDDDDLDDEYDEQQQRFAETFRKLIKNLPEEDLIKMRDNFLKSRHETNRHKKTAYHYDAPEYPETLDIKHDFVFREISNPDNGNQLPESVIKKILELPASEVIEDLTQIVLYTIGSTRQPNDKYSPKKLQWSPTLLHAVILIGYYGSEESIAPILEILCQSFEFVNFHFGDTGDIIFIQALYNCAKGNIKSLEELVYTPGLSTFNRITLIRALAMMAYHNSKLRPQIINFFRQLLSDMLQGVKSAEIWDAEFAGLMMMNILDLHATELLPEVKDLFDADCVDLNMVGDFDSFMQSFESDKPRSNDFKFMNMNDIYRWMDRSFN